VINFELYGGENHGFAIGFTFITFAIFLVFFQIFRYAHFVPYDKWLGSDSDYVKENYPEIWKLFAPHLQSWRVTPLLRFLRGRYDDGTDERLNRVKQEMNDNHWILGGGFFLMVGLEMLNIILHSLS
jgi:hypothetical protein